MPIFIERYLLPFLAAVTVLLSVANPMHWDWKPRFTGSFALICTALLVSRVLHKYNQQHRFESVPNATKPKRLLIPAEVTLEQISQPFQELTQIQAIRATERYIGKWMRYSGEITNIVKGNAIFLRDRENQDGRVVAIFEDDWRERLELLPRGKRITVEGQISNIESAGVWLKKSEIIQEP